METELVVIKPAKLEEVHVNGRVANVSIRFESEQINLVKDQDGNVVDGDPDNAETVTDIWTFQRHLSSQDPNWQLVATRSVD